MFIKNKKFGFTLIELLVVIAVIGLLSTLAIAYLNSARVKARDARRKSDLRQIEAALELYYDKHGSYPAGGSWRYSTAGGDWIPGLAEFISPLPVDPVNNAAGPWVTGNYSYSYGWNVAAGTCPGYPAGDCSGQTYDLVAQLENTSDKDTCYNKCWNIHTWSAGDPWCNSSPNCGGIRNYSVYLYADH